MTEKERNCLKNAMNVIDRQIRKKERTMPTLDNLTDKEIRERADYLLGQRHDLICLRKAYCAIAELVYLTEEL